MKSQAFLWSVDGGGTALGRTTIREIGQDEQFLEERIGEWPDILGLHTLSSGIRGPFQVFHRLPLPSPTGRTIAPDVVLVSASAHLIAVEVKLADNPELLNRSVVAQIVEYAACIAALNERSLADLFGGSSLAALAAEWFPDLDDADEFADVLAQRCQEGNIDLVVACDRCPPGLHDLVAGMDRLSALAFRLQLVEIAPWVAPTTPGRILFLNHVPLRTEIVARTQVSVTWEGGGEKPNVTVMTTPLEDIEEAMQDARAGTSSKRHWSPADIREWLTQSDTLASEERNLVEQLLRFAENNSPGGRATSKKTAHPSFGFRMSLGVDGSRDTALLWTVSPNMRLVFVFEFAVRKHLSAVDAEHAVRQFSRWIGARVDGGLNPPDSGGFRGGHGARRRPDSRRISLSGSRGCAGRRQP